jgi:hypothetical protein
MQIRSKHASSAQPHWMPKAELLLPMHFLFRDEAREHLIYLLFRAHRTWLPAQMLLAFVLPTFLYNRHWKVPQNLSATCDVLFVLSKHCARHGACVSRTHLGRFSRRASRASVIIMYAW